MINELSRKLLFLTVGGLTFIINVSFLYLLKEILKVNHNIALTIAFFIGTTFHFSANKFVTFKEKKIATISLQIPKYIAMTLINYLINLIVINIFVYFHLAIYLGAICATMITMVLTYFIMNIMIFKQK